MYAKYFKRVLDFSLSLIAVVILSPVFLILILSGFVAMRGNPFFIQPRPGKKDKYGNEKIFKLIKFRTMDDRKDENGNLLSDNERINKYGRFLRATSLDELPELFNILLGEMSIVGPRPQLVKDMVFMTDIQRLRHTVRPGLTGLAQVSGRNALEWLRKLELDLQYIENITFMGDLKIILKTVVLILGLGNSEEFENETEIAEDYGDYLLGIGQVQIQDYNIAQEKAKELLERV